MNSGFPIKPVALLFVCVCALYFGVFHGLEFLRHRKGAWVIDFQTASDGSPALKVSQTALGLSNFTLVLRGEPMTNQPGQVWFDRVRRPVPFGRVIYEDLTFLPGVITFDLYGHEIELLPRMLVANKQQIPWHSGDSVDLWPSNKPAQPPQPPTNRRR